MAKKQVATHIAHYQFICEHCGNDSGWKDVSVTGKNEFDLHEKKLPDAQKAEVRGDYLSCLPMNSGKCKACGHRQSWEVGRIATRMQLALYIGIILGFLGSFIVSSIYGGGFGLLWYVLGFLFGFPVGFIFGFVVNIILYFRIKSDTKKTSNRFKPNINWSAQVEQPVLICGNQKLCLYCNAPLMIDSQFCTSCGKPIS